MNRREVMRGKGIGNIFKVLLLMVMVMGLMGAGAAWAITTVFSINYEDPAGWWAASC